MTSQIPNYEIKRMLGEGGMAVVYLAEHRLLHNQVAIKVLNEEFVRNKNIRARFLTEARSMARMSHSHIIKVTDLIDDGDTVAFVMEYIEGETLKEYLDRKGKLNSEEIGGLLEQMLSALEYAHEQGLVHRDIKPSNFMVSPQGKLKLLDFGIAKQTNPGSPEYTITGTNQRMGTAMYMSPEQIHETRSVTPRSDIYSLGVVLWQMVMGMKPYATETLSAFQLQTKIVNEPLPLTGTNWDSPIKKATEKDSQHRYADISAFRSAWQKGQNDFNERRDSGDKTVMEQQPKQPIPQTPPRPVEPPQKLSFVIPILILLVLIVAGYFISKGNEGTQIEETLSSITENENESIASSVIIGDQEWQTKNLDVDRFRNGEPISYARTYEEWTAAGERRDPAWCYYDNDTKNGKIYGKLYNWYAVNDARGLAPEGWHIPSDNEWTTLTDYLGGEEVAGSKMKATGTAYWNSPNTDATNESGFSALPGGFRSFDGSFGYMWNSAKRRSGFFWSATEYKSTHEWSRVLHDESGYAWSRVLHDDGSVVYRDSTHIYNNKSVGAYVRCLRD
jgi:uncharacterized protein (TIGR02145 family)